MSWLDSASAGGDRYLQDTIRLLWPAPAQLSTGRRPDPAAGPCRGYLVVPSAHRPKVLIPATPRRAAAAAIRGFKSTQGRREARLLAGFAAALRLGAGAVLPDRLYVTAPPNATADDLETRLGIELRQPVHLSLHISRPRAVRKPVLQVIDDAGRSFAFAKLGVDDLTDRLVLAEAETVRRLSAMPWQVLRVPSVLHSGSWHGHPLLVQGSLGRAGDADSDSQALAAAMDELARAGGTQRVPLATSPYWTSLLERARRLPATQLRDTIIESMTMLAAGCGTSVVEFGSWHGDWTPWNMNLAAGRVQVWDWEKFESDVPVGFDAAHYFVQRAVVWGSREPADVFAELVERADPLQAGHRLAAGDARLACWLYSLSLAVGYLEDGELEAGTSPVTRLASWLPATLHRAAGRLVPATTTS